MTQTGLTRREAIARAAATAAAIGLTASVSLKSRLAKAAGTPAPAPDATADVVGLNALLAAEQSAITAYTAGAGLIAKDTASPAALVKVASDVAAHFLGQHKNHAKALTALITANGGTPVTDAMNPNLPASFPLATAGTIEVLKLACDKERQAAFAYADTVGGFTTATAAKLAASIGGVETQHFIVLFLIVGGFIVPGATLDPAAANYSPSLVVPGDFVVAPDGLAADGSDGVSLDALIAKGGALDVLLTIDTGSTGAAGTGGAGGSN